MSRRQLHHERALLVGFAALMLIMVWTTAFLRSSRDMREAEVDAVQQLSNLSLAFAESTISKLQSADQVVRLVRREVQRSGPSFDLKESADFSGLIDRSLRQLAIIGADGFLSDSSLPFSRVDLSDREHFRVHQQVSDDRLFISRPVVGRVSGQRTLQVTRRIDNPDGRFGGVVVLSLATDRLTNIYSSLDLGAQGVITLVGSDGWVRAHRTVRGDQSDQNISQNRAFQAALKAPFGTALVVSSTDQIERLYSFRRLEPYDLIALVGRSREDILANVHELRRLYVGMARMREQQQPLAVLTAISVLICVALLVIGTPQIYVGVEGYDARSSHMARVVDGYSFAERSAREYMAATGGLPKKTIENTKPMPML